MLPPISLPRFISQPVMPSQALSKPHRMSYRIGRGEQGVLTFEPYKSEILPLWRFKTPAIAKKSSEQIYDKFIEYEKCDDFVGMDMCRKFLQMVSHVFGSSPGHGSTGLWSNFDDTSADVAA